MSWLRLQREPVRRLRSKHYARKHDCVPLDYGERGTGPRTAWANDNARGRLTDLRPTKQVSQ
jgi:hypothetical protein